MKVLILTGKFGMGHVSVAEALREELAEQSGTRAHVVDIIEYMFPKAVSVMGYTEHVADYMGQA